MKEMKTIVAVSGGFDPLHRGHIRYLKEAKQLGDELVVILNTDVFLIKKKGYLFMPYRERKEILESVRCVDRVVRCIDKDQTVAKTLELVRPHVFAKGGDRTIENIPESERATCQKWGIKLVFGVGGKKIQSSSWLIKNLVERLGGRFDFVETKE
jgi:D-beta-D-heptose 7-phosphate kinase/D-beta-D-heptose 1-phosphate adenosyltransferase